MTRLDLPTPDGLLDVYLAQPSAIAPGGAGGQRPAWPPVIVYMDAFGVRPQLLEMLSRLARAGYVVALPNLYYRSGAFAPFDPVQVHAGGAERERFKRMIASITDTMVMRDTAILIDALAERPDVRPGPMAAVGYCMGGGFALSALGTFPDRLACAAAFHGGSLATDKPDSPHLLAPRMRGRLYIGVAGLDPSFPPEQRQRLEEALDAAGVNYTLEVYEGAKHGFAVTGHMVYDHAASEHHWERLLHLLRETL